MSSLSQAVGVNCSKSTTTVIVCESQLNWTAPPTEYNGNTIHILEPCRDQCDGDVFRLDDIVTCDDIFRPDDVVTRGEILRPVVVVTRGVVLRPGEVMGSVLT